MLPEVLTEEGITYLRYMGGLVAILSAFQFSRLHGTALFRKIGYFIYYVVVFVFLIEVMLALSNFLIYTIPFVVYREITKRPGERTNQGGKAASRYIPRHIKYKVWRRDNGRCQHDGCEAYFDIRFGPVTIFTNLHFDHIIPIKKGGATTVNNLQLLCAKHNWRKGAN